MTHKVLHFRAEAQTKVLKGATALADAVRITLGPKSKSVLMQRKWGKPLVCDDGVTIAKEIVLEDPEENLGAQMMREAAEKTGDAVGDGTTTSAILAHAIFAEGLRNVVAGASAVDLKRGLQRGLRAAVDALAAQARPVSTHQEKVQVATISAHGDATVGQLVAEAVERVGDEGVVSVEEAKGIETSTEVVEGLQFDRGYLSSYFVSDPEAMQAVLEDPLVLLHEKKLGSVKDLLPLLERVARLHRPLLVVAEDVEGEALATLVINKVRGAFPCAAVKAPGYGDRRRELLEDIAVLCGGKVVTAELGIELEGVGEEELGQAARVVIDRDSTTIIGGRGARAAIEGRLALLRAQLAEAKGEYEREKLEERVAKLSGGVAVIRVGAPTEAELKSKKDAFDDAIASTKAAVAEGVLPGGGLALLRAIASVRALEPELEGDQRTGLKILQQALAAPARQIALNSGADAGVVVDRLLQRRDGNLGFDGARGEFVDLVEAGIIDPAKVVRIALENAVSVAGTLLLTEATLTEEPERNGDGGPHGGVPPL
ncbi:MAG: chaperonin GroEL [Planctomycetota bacterium]